MYIFSNIFSRGEYFLIDYLEKVGNFNSSYVDSIFAVEGYYDLYNFSKEELSGAVGASTNSRRKTHGRLDDKTRTYDFIFIPNNGFLNSNLPLMTDCELKLSFDRVNAEVALVENGGSVTTDSSGSPLVLKDVIAIAEYTTSDELQTYFMKIDHNPIPYYYQECDVTLKSLPQDETIIRLDNIKGGNTPTCLFAAIIPAAALNGDMEQSSTAFDHHNVTEFNITLNGNSVNGFPMEVKSPVLPYYQFMDVTSRYMNPACGDGLKMSQFMHSWIYAHKFEAEVSSQGWLGINLKLSTAFSKPHTLVIWCINDCALTIDKFHQIEKLNL